MIISIPKFYKVIILSIGLFGSEIIKEEHFKSEEDAKQLINQYQGSQFIGVLAEM